MINKLIKIICQINISNSKLIVIMNMHVFIVSGEAYSVSVSEGEEVAVSGGRLRLSSASVLPQISGADGVCTTHHWTGGNPVTEDDDGMKSRRQEKIDTNMMTVMLFQMFPNFIHMLNWCMKALELKLTWNSAHNPFYLHNMMYL